MQITLVFILFSSMMVSVSCFLLIRILTPCLQLKGIKTKEWVKVFLGWTVRNNTHSTTLDGMMKDSDSTVLFVPKGFRQRRVCWWSCMILDNQGKEEFVFSCYLSDDLKGH